MLLALSIWEAAFFHRKMFPLSVWEAAFFVWKNVFALSVWEAAFFLWDASPFHYRKISAEPVYFFGARCLPL